jgi:hypothetical protein
LLIESFIWDAVRNHSNRYNEMHGFASILAGVRTYALGISFDFQKKPFILQEVPGNFIRFLRTCVLLRIASASMIGVYFARATPRDFIGFCAIHGASKTCLGATPLDQGYDGTEIKYFANCNEGRGAAGSAWCP